MCWSDMASRRKAFPKTAADSRTYAEFMRGLLNGTIRATSLVDTQEPTGEVRTRTVRTENQLGQLVNIQLDIPVMRLVTVQYDDPDPDRPGAPQGIAAQEGK